MKNELLKHFKSKIDELRAAFICCKSAKTTEESSKADREFCRLDSRAFYSFRGDLTDAINSIIDDEISDIVSKTKDKFSIDADHDEFIKKNSKNLRKLSIYFKGITSRDELEDIANSLSGVIRLFEQYNESNSEKDREVIEFAMMIDLTFVLEFEDYGNSDFYFNGYPEMYNFEMNEISEKIREEESEKAEKEFNQIAKSDDYRTNRIDT